MRLLLTLLITAGLTSSGECPPGQPGCFPGGIADLGRNVAYIQVMGGGIDVIDLAKGERLWHTNLGTKPLAAYGSQLVAAAVGPRRNELGIVILSPGRETSSLKTIEVIFPEAVNTTDSAFWYGAALEQDILILDWRYGQPFRGGAARQPGAPYSRALDLAGVEEINLRTGQVSTKDRTATSESLPKPEPAKGERLLPYRRFSEWTTDPWHAGSSSAWLIAEQKADRQSVSLVKSVEAGIRETFPLLSGRNPFAYVTSDGCYLLLLRESPEERQPWFIFSVNSGKKTGQIEFEKGAESPVIIRSHAYWLLNRAAGRELTETVLRAADIRSGKLIWEYALGVRAIDHRPMKPQ